MSIKFNKILKNLFQDLNNLDLEKQSTIESAEEGIKITKKAIDKIRNHVIANGFKTKKDEISFFKNVKPKIYSKLIYFVKLINIESHRPRSSNKNQIKYLNKNIDKLQVYFTDNLEFYHYYRTGATFLDEQYFLRGKVDIRLQLDTLYSFIDDQFSTSHDNTVAKIIAHDLLIIYLKEEIQKLEDNGMETTAINTKHNSKLFWTANKTDLVELIYAIHSSKSLNSGTADIKKIAQSFEQIFNIELGDYYRTYLEIKSRKIQQVKFLDKLKEALLSKIEDSNI